jgi:UDP-N-acetylglucosamine 2-epimerase (non-hydrolysing)
MPIVFPIHPRSRKMLRDLKLEDEIDCIPGLRIIDPVGYIDFLHLMDHARLVLTDSGGIQEETTVLGVHCLTLRQNTERPVTVREGTNRVVGSDPERIVREAKAVLHSKAAKLPRPELWDGSAARRIVAVLIKNPIATVSSKKGGKNEGSAA